MTTYQITIDEQTTLGKSVIEVLSRIEGVQIKKVNNESPYNKAFVKEIQKSRASKGKAINTEDLWK
jgi:hypothetical protein